MYVCVYVYIQTKNNTNMYHMNIYSQCQPAIYVGIYIQTENIWSESGYSVDIFNMANTHHSLFMTCWFCFFGNATRFWNFNFLGRRCIVRLPFGTACEVRSWKSYDKWIILFRRHLRFRLRFKLGKFVESSFFLSFYVFVSVVHLPLFSIHVQLQANFQLQLIFKFHLNKSYIGDFLKLSSHYICACCAVHVSFFTRLGFVGDYSMEL